MSLFNCFALFFSSGTGVYFNDSRKAILEPHDGAFQYIEQRKLPEKEEDCPSII
jgi:POLO box duplicated region